MDLQDIVFLFLVLVASALGAGLVAYAKEKFLNYATKEDFDEIIKQAKKLTQITEEIKSELSIAKTIYEQYLHEILNYYKNIYEYYRLCQNVVNADKIIKQGEDEKLTKDIFFERLDEIVKKCKDNEGYINLLLPEKMLKINFELFGVFNKFKNQLKSRSSSPDFKSREMVPFFKDIEEKKEELKRELQILLRVNKLVNN